jgi:hypothetical protein
MPMIPKKYVPFSPGDSKAIETAFQKLSDEEDAAEREKHLRGSDIADESDDIGVSDEYGTKLRKSGTETSRAMKVPVNEDYLFDVDIEQRELAPTYWLGPVYDVRRGTWFFQGMCARTPLTCLNKRSTIPSARNSISPGCRSLLTPVAPSHIFHLVSNNFLCSSRLFGNVMIVGRSRNIYCHHLSHYMSMVFKLEHCKA